MTYRQRPAQTITQIEPKGFGLSYHTVTTVACSSACMNFGFSLFTDLVGTIDFFGIKVTT